MGCLVLREPARSKYTWTFHKSHFVWKLTWKVPDANPATPVLCEPARSKCTWAFQKSYFVWKLIGKSPRTPPGTSFCASLRGRNAHGHVTRGILNVAHVAHGHRFFRACAIEMHMDISQEPVCKEIYGNWPDTDEYLDWTPGLNCYQCGHTVWATAASSKKI